MVADSDAYRAAEGGMREMKMPRYNEPAPDCAAMCSYVGGTPSGPKPLFYIGAELRPNAIPD